MQVTNVSATPAGAGTNNNAGATSTLDYNAFLKLLMAQMKNQDPTSPTDSTQWVSQLATFSSVEQAIKTNAKLDSILANSTLSDAGSLIGRTVMSADGRSGGVIVAISTSQNGSIALLKDGSTLDLSSGVTIS